MDPATIIGTTGAVVGIIDVLAKTIQTLRGLRTRWNIVDLTVSNLITQLNSLKAALNKISEWIQSDLSGSPQHYQLVMDLEEAVVCCRILVESIDNKIELLNRDSANSLEIHGKVKAFFSDGDFNIFQTFVERQISALNLLLTACNCKTLSEQKSWLDKPGFRKTIDQVRDDSSSLIVLCDTISLMSRYTSATTSTAEFSAVFPFDSELMASQVYQRTVRGLFKRTTRVENTAKSAIPSQLRQPEHFRRLPVATESSKTSKDSQAAIARRQLVGRRECQIVLTGLTAHGLSVILWALQIVLDENKSAVRYALLAQAVTGLQDFYESQRDTILACSVEPLKDLTSLALRRVDAVNPKIQPAQLIAVQELWKRMPKDVQTKASQPLHALMERILIMACFTYQPAVEDIENALTLKTISSHRIEPRLGNFTCRTFVYQQPSEALKRHSFSFEHFSTICYVVDLASYDDGPSEVLIKESEILSNLQAFKATIESGQGSYRSAIVFFTNCNLFEEWFSSSGRPYNDACGPYLRRGQDAKKALDHIIDRFRRICAKPIKLYPYVVGMEYTHICRNVKYAMEDIVRQQYVESVEPSPKDKPHPLGQETSRRMRSLDEADDITQTAPSPISDGDSTIIDLDKVSKTGLKNRTISRGRQKSYLAVHDSFSIEVDDTVTSYTPE